MNKEKCILLDSMNALGFDIADIKYQNKQEWYAHKMQNSDQLVWFHITQGGSGFEQLFTGAIKGACEYGMDLNKR